MVFNSAAGIHSIKFYVRVECFLEVFGFAKRARFEVFPRFSRAAWGAGVGARLPRFVLFTLFRRPREG